MREGAALYVGVVDVEDDGGEHDSQGHVAGLGGRHPQRVHDHALEVVHQEEEQQHARHTLAAMAALREDNRCEDKGGKSVLNRIVLTSSARGTCFDQAHKCSISAL